MTLADPVTQKQLDATISPIQLDIAAIKTAVEPIGAILVETQATNFKVAEHETKISKLENWQQRVIGASGVVVLALGGVGVYIVQEVF